MTEYGLRSSRGVQLEARNLFSSSSMKLMALLGRAKTYSLYLCILPSLTAFPWQSNTFIHKLVQLTQDKPWKKSLSFLPLYDIKNLTIVLAGRSGKGRDPNAKRPILRPIICICNDQNAASLTKLRAHALQIRFARPADIHTVKRLREVCEIEGLKADSRALTTLVGVARGDLRGCLNTLQVCHILLLFWGV